MERLMNFLAVLPLMGLALVAHAASDLAWLEQNLKNPEAVVQYSNGKIAGAAYTAAVAKRGNATESDRPVLVIFETHGEERKLLTEIELGGQVGTAVMIKSNSIYIRQDYAHHGIRFTQYQFKRSGGEFKMVGIESQDMSLSGYGVSPKELNSPGYKDKDMWSGTSVNLLTSRGECWLKMLDLPTSDNLPPEYKDAYARFERGVRPKSAVTGEIRFAQEALVPLSSFNPDTYDLDHVRPGCYFDYKKRLHRITTSPK
jgi:hypothetical protein